MAHAPPTPEVRTRPTTEGNPSIPRPQKDLVEEMLAEIGSQHWEFAAAIITRMLSPKVFRGDPGSESETKAYPALDSFQCLVQADRVPSIMASMPTPPEIDFVAGKKPNFPPLAAFFNSCITNCDEAYRALVSAQIMFRGSALQPQDRRLWPTLEFRVYDRATQDGVQGAAALKPSLVGVAATTSARPACYWSLPAQPPKGARKILIPVEVGGDWPEIVGHAGTYARAQVNVVPLRLFSLVIGVNYESRSLRFLIYHRGGLTASQELKLDEPAGRRHVQEIMFSIVLWQTSEDAGFPSFTNGIETLIPSTDRAQPTRAFTDKVLFHSLSIRGRGTLVYEVVRSFERKGSLVPVRQARNPLDAILLTENLRAVVSVDEASRAHVKPRSARIKPRSARSKPRLYHDKAPQGVYTLVPGVSLPSQSPTEFVLKFSWPNRAKRGLEPKVYASCSGQFGVPQHLLSFEVCRSDGAAYSNSNFLPPKDAITFADHWWKLHGSESGDPSPPDYRTLAVTATADIGRSLGHCKNAWELGEGALHGQLGWLSMMNIGGSSGFMHRDVSIGNVLWLDTPVERPKFSTRTGVAKLVDRATEIIQGLASLQLGGASPPDDGTSDGSLGDEASQTDAEQLAQQPDFWTALRLKAAKKDHHLYLEQVVNAAERLEKALAKLELSGQCKALLIDGDMAAFLPDYFSTSEHSGVISGTPEFMSNALRDAVEYGMAYVQGPVDDLQSWMWTTLWATVFNPAASEGINVAMSVRLHEWQAKFTSDSYERSAVLTIMEHSLRHMGLVWDMSPLFRKWFLALMELRDEFDAAWETPDLESAQKLLIFYQFALRGVAEYAELLYDLKHGRWAGLVARVDGV